MAELRVENLSGDDAVVYRAVAALEAVGRAPHLPEVARHAGLDVEHTRTALHHLLTSEPSLVHEVADTGAPDLGPIYELAPRT